MIDLKFLIDGGGGGGSHTATQAQKVLVTTTSSRKSICFLRIKYYLFQEIFLLII